ncbi:MAG TPA: hypothetical protein VFE31_00545 [Opitutaceae bacterium]|nr:hypothetical protein [Opitutaceae bacterium]
MATSAINQPFSAFGPAARTKVLMLGEPDGRLSEFCSFPIERVSFRPNAEKINGPLAQARKWYFGRSPDAGFLLEGFPATLLQAKMFDEWLEARHEGLDAVLAGPGAPAPVVAHYRSLGLIA